MLRKLILMGLGATALTLDITREVAHKLVGRGEEAVAAIRQGLQEPGAGKAVPALPAGKESLAASREGDAQAGAAQRVPIGSGGDA